MSENKEIRKQPAGLSNDFQQELESKKNKKNWVGIISASLVFVVLILIIGVGSYQIFFKTVEIDQNNNSKIESKPAENEVKVQPSVKSETPDQATIPETQIIPTEHVVVEGDNLGAIAIKYETTVEKLKTANSIQDETSLQIGQIIKIVK